MSLRPICSRSDIWLFNVSDCVDDPACTGNAGGLFKSWESRTVMRDTKESWNGSSETISQDDGNNTYFSDVIHLGANSSTNDFPFYMNPRELRKRFVPKGFLIIFL